MSPLVLLGAALAAPFGQVDLVAGSPEFGGCIAGDREDADTCAGKFYRFLTDSLLTQGFTFQGQPAAGSAVFQREAGWMLGARLDSFPLGPPPENLSGKPENTQFSPVLPRLMGAYRLDQARDLSLGASLLPPIPVGGASALVLGVEASLAGELGPTRLGGALELGYARARAPIVASEEQFESREDWSNPDNLDPETYEAVCGASERGCLDTFQQLTVGAHAQAAWSLGAFQPYARLNLSFLVDSLYVMYDDTTWRLLALQPGLGAGSALDLGRATLHLGGDLAPLGPNQSETQALGLLWKLEGSASWRL